MATSPPSITALPSPPDPNNRGTFNALAYPWSVAQQTLATQVGAVATNVYDNAVDAAASAATATAKEVLTTADAVATAADAVATAADRVQTGIDRSVVEGIAITAGVASLNGQTGPVTTVDGTNAFGFRNVPQNSQSAAYGLVLADAGKHILHPSADTTARTFTIPANSSVAYPLGTALTFVNQASAGVVTISITTDTMRLAGIGTTGDRSLAANGIATAMKITATEWIISGKGLT